MIMLLQSLTGEQIVSIVTTIAPIMVAMVTVVGAIFAAYFSFKSVKAAEKAQTASVKSVEVAEVASKKADVIIEKAAEIHTLTNSNLSAVKAVNEKLQAEVAGMRELITSLVKDKEVKEAIALKLAEKVVNPNLVAPVAPSPVAPVAPSIALSLNPKERVVIEGTLEKKDEGK